MNFETQRFALNRKVESGRHACMARHARREIHKSPLEIVFIVEGFTAGSWLKESSTGCDGILGLQIRRTCCGWM